MTVWSPAKVNLFLEVLAKRADGYHDIASLMLAVSLFDTLEFADNDSGGVELTCDHPSLSAGPDNLVVRAAELLRKMTGCGRGASIRLTKRIPLAAGLAGGSTDAAAALAGLNVLWGLGVDRTTLAQWAAEVGSDVAFFFAAPAAWCTGRGEKVHPLTPGRTYHLVLVSPSVGLSTADVYRGVEVPDRPLAGEEMCRAFEAGDVERVGRLLHNRLQTPAERLCPVVAAIRSRLEAFRPAGQLMSGSGSTLFALCRDRTEAERIARAWAGQPIAEDGVGANVFVVRGCF